MKQNTEDFAHPPLPALLRGLHDFLPDDGPIAFGQILTRLEEAGVPLVLLFLALLTAVPVPIPGLRVILGMPVTIVAVHLLLGRHTIWLPKRILRHEIQSAPLKGALRKTLPYVEKLQNFTRPRMGWLVGQAFFLRTLGFCALLMALSIFAPLPFSNVFPSLCMAVMCAGLLYNDGALALLGAFVGTLWVVTLFILVAVLGMEVFNWLLAQMLALF